MESESTFIAIRNTKDVEVNVNETDNVQDMSVKDAVFVPNTVNVQDTSVEESFVAPNTDNVQEMSVKDAVVVPNTDNVKEAFVAPNTDNVQDMSVKDTVVVPNTDNVQDISLKKTVVPPNIDNVKYTSVNEAVNVDSAYENLKYELMLLPGNPHSIFGNMEPTTSKDTDISTDNTDNQSLQHNLIDKCIMPETTKSTEDGAISENANSLSNVDIRSPKVNLYAEDTGPKLYPVKGSIVTPPIITKNLPEAFKYLPVFGMPKNTTELLDFQDTKVREFIGCDLSDEEFRTLSKFCSPDNLRTGNELVMTNRFPTQEPLPDHIVSAQTLTADSHSNNLCLVKKLRLRVNKDTRHAYMKKLKYRGVRMLPLPQNEDYKISFSPLEPGKDLVFRIRVYRPFYCNSRERHNTRHSIFSNDIVVLGRQKLSVLRDRMVCPNDIGMRLDVSENPDEQPAASAKELFPSGFLFINNVFYVDTRPGCVDYTEALREWARRRKLGDFQRRDMTQVAIDEVLVKLGHPEVYVHQGNCEHLFTFSEVRLLSPTDPLRQSVYPFHTAISQYQTIYCTTCAEFGAKWIVTGCARVPFDPAFFCETCFKLYLYNQGKKVCDFKAYSYRGNEMNILKPLG